MIHPTAIIHPKAQLDSTVRVGAYAIVDDGVVLGPGCRIGPYVQITGNTTIGASNEIHSGCVIGGSPQDLKYGGDPTCLKIGDHNIFREHVTVNRSSSLAEHTVIGSHNLLMANTHIGHNSQLGNHIIIANGALLGGHVSVGDRAVISGNCLVHQFVRIGSLAIMQGGAAISKDLPPFTIAHGYNAICGLNTVGLRRAGFTAEQRLELKQLYHLLFRSAQSLTTRLEVARGKFTGQWDQMLLEFITASKRGVCQEVISLRRSRDQPVRQE
jgi:UDP-N-acetylglucosamine acyltransferase